MTMPLRAAKPVEAGRENRGEAGARPRRAAGRQPAARRSAPGNSIAETGVARPGLRSVDGRRAGHRLVARRSPATSAVRATSRRWSIASAARGISNQGASRPGHSSSSRFSVTARSTDYIVEKPSGSTPLDLAALRAVAVTKTLPPLPNEYTESDARRSPELRIQMKHSILAGVDGGGGARRAGRARSNRRRSRRRPPNSRVRSAPRSSAKPANRLASRSPISSRSLPTPKPSRSRRSSARCSGTTSTSSTSSRSSRATSTRRFRRRRRSPTCRSIAGAS